MKGLPFSRPQRMCRSGQPVALTTRPSGEPKTVRRQLRAAGYGGARAPQLEHERAHPRLRRLRVDSVRARLRAGRRDLRIGCALAWDRVLAGRQSRHSRRSPCTLDGRWWPPHSARGLEPPLLRGTRARILGRGRLVPVRHPGRPARLAGGRVGDTRAASRWRSGRAERQRRGVPSPREFPSTWVRRAAPRGYTKGQSPLHAAVGRRYFELLASRAGV
jgi:hypothetical protein